MTLIESLKTTLPNHIVSSENGMICVKSEANVRIQLWTTHCVGIFSLDSGTIIVQLPLDPGLPDYNDKMMFLIRQILNYRGIVSNYRSDFSSIPALFVQVESQEILKILVSRLGGMLFLSEHIEPVTYNFTEKDVVLISKFFDDPENYKFGRDAIYCWNRETDTLFEEFQSKLFTAGPCETPDNSLFANITWEIYRFRCHVRSMRKLNVCCLTKDSMDLHLRKSYNTTEQLETANKKRIVEFCNLDRETFSPISLQEKDLSDVKEETGDDTLSLGKRIRS
jgi:hypothetical protein